MNLRLALLGLAFAVFGHAGWSDESALHTLYVEKHDGSEISMTLADLDALDQVVFSTSTIWTDGVVEFSGVPVWTILGHAEADGATLRMVALNDYAIEMPVGELEEAVPIVATRMDGETMSIRDKGPFWVIYPFDADPAYASETNHSRSVWQLSRLVLIE